MKTTRVLQVLGLACVLLAAPSPVHATYVTIENIGGSPITAAALTFIVPSGSGITDQIVSPRVRIDPTNIYFDFDEGAPNSSCRNVHVTLDPANYQCQLRLKDSWDQWLQHL